MKKLNLITLILITLITSAAAQEQRSPVWLEGSVGFKSPDGDYTTDCRPFNFSLGYNRFYNEHASWGIMLEYNQFPQLTPAIGSNSGFLSYKQHQVALTPNLSLSYPLSRHISWTPRLYLSIGLTDISTAYHAPDGPIDYSGQTLYPLELGARLASFDFHLGDRCALNLNFDPLNAYLRLSAARYDDEYNSLTFGPLQTRLPFGKVFEDHSDLGSSRALCTVSFRYRF